MLVGDVALLLCAVAGVVYFWPREVTLAGYAVLQVACLFCQAVTLAPAVWDGVPDLHHNATLALVAGIGVFGVPAAMMAVFLTGNADGPPLAAVLMAGTALLMACVAGLISGTFLSSRDGTGARGTGSTGHSGDESVEDFGGGGD